MMSFATVLLGTGISYLFIRIVLPLPGFDNDYMGTPISHKGVLVLTASVSRSPVLTVPRIASTTVAPFLSTHT